MYFDLYKIFNKKTDSLNIEYKGVKLDIFNEDDSELPAGEHIVFGYDTGAVTSAEIGFNSAETLESFLQFKVKVPLSDKYKDQQLAIVLDQFRTQFARSSFVESDVKVEWLAVQSPIIVTVAGYRAMTVRVNYRVFANC